MSTATDEFPKTRMDEKEVFHGFAEKDETVHGTREQREILDIALNGYVSISEVACEGGASEVSDDQSKKPLMTTVATQTSEDDTPATGESPKCLKHQKRGAVVDIVPAEKPSLCEKCSKSMLSYIAMVQQFLDGVAVDISKQVDPLSECVECVKESLCLPKVNIHAKRECEHAAQEHGSHVKAPTVAGRRKDVESADDVDAGHGNDANGRVDGTKVSEKSKSDSLKQPTKSRDRVPSQTAGKRKASSKERKSLDMGFIYDKPDHEKSRAEQEAQTVVQETSDAAAHGSQDAYKHASHLHMESVNIPPGSVLSTHASRDARRRGSKQRTKDLDRRRPADLKQQTEDIARKDSADHSYSSDIRPADNALETVSADEQQETVYHGGSEESQTVRDLHGETYTAPAAQTSADPSAAVVSMDDRPSRVSIQGAPSPQFYHGDGVDGILSTLYRVERGLSDIAKGPTVWERVAEMNGSGEAAERTSHEAFVTLARNNVDAIGCLVLGASLLLCRTKKTLCVLVADAVSPAFMAPLSSVFHVVQHVRSLDSLGTTKLALLDQPELGITFVKLNVWRLEQFTKCVFLNCDTLVVQNCDELFCHGELSAVPDIGWPDCFNSAVFVFRPSVKTFWSLLEFAEKQGSYDGGDQGLLNTYFSYWSQDIHKKLSFIYNLMANVSYTYTPAFKQFGRNVKIVQFMGTFKPWHVKFYSASGQIAPASPVHPTYVQFVHVWLNVFRVSILPLLSQEIQSYASSQNIVSAHELLRFFPSPAESEIEFLLAPPSVRLRPSDRRPSQGSQNAIARTLRLPSSTSLSSTSSAPPSGSAGAPTTRLEISPEGKTKPLPEPQSSQTDQTPASSNEEAPVSPTADEVFFDAAEETKDANAANAPADDREDSEKAADEGNDIPGSAFGNYQGMKAWEQGRMDYQGSDSSDTIIRRLHFLMEKPERAIRTSEKSIQNPSAAPPS